MLESCEGVSLGIVVRFCICGLVGLQYVGILALKMRVLLSMRS